MDAQPLGMPHTRGFLCCLYPQPRTYMGGKINKSTMTNASFIATSRDQGFPIQRLPLEILIEVFTFCLPGPDKQHTISKLDAPLVLCNVCSSWRNLTITTPRLWSTFDFCIGYYTRWALNDKNIAECIHTWLGRSGHLPLTIRFRGDLPPPISAKLFSSMSEMYDALSSYADRWENVEIMTLLPFSSWPTPDVMTFLRSLHIQGPLDKTPFTSAPHLTKLSLSGFRSTPATIPAIPWNQLTNLTILTGPTLFIVAELIQSCPRLKFLSVGVDHHREDDASSINPRIEHANLSTVEFHLNRGCRVLLQSLVLPALTKLTLDYYQYNTFSIEENGSCQRVLIGLLRRSNCKLQHLLLINCAYDPSELLVCLEQPGCRTLTHLAICSQYEDVLSVDNPLLARLTRFEDKPERLLCPELTDLRLKMCCSEICAGWLGRMVWSRCTGPLEGSGNRLRSFSFTTTHRLSDEDMGMLRQAKAYGLKLSYLAKEYSDYDRDYDIFYDD